MTRNKWFGAAAILAVLIAGAGYLGMDELIELLKGLKELL